MATHKAIWAVSKALVQMLEAGALDTGFDHDLEFAVYSAKNFTTPMTAGVSLFVYRVVHSGTQRGPQGRLNPNGRRQRARLPVDLRFMLTVWAGSPSLQHELTGWMMRVVEDNPILPAGILNAAVPNAFQADEIVEVSPDDLATEDLLRLWEGLVQNTYHLSVPYVARTLLIESTYDAPFVGPLVQTRELCMVEPEAVDR